MLLGDPFNSSTLEFVAYVHSDAEGRFDFLGIHDGLYGLYYQLPQNRQTYQITEVPSGTYALVVKRSDYIQFMKPFELEVGQLNKPVSWAIKPCTASVTGTLTINPQKSMLICNSDLSVMGYIPSQNDGTYHVNNLPEGHYRIGTYYTIRTAPTAEFDLTEGETAVIDIDVGTWSSLNRGALHTQILNRQNVPLSDTQVWLEAADQFVIPYKENSEGQFFVTEPGSYTLMVETPGNKKVSHPVTLKPVDLMAVGTRQATKNIYVGI